VFINRILSPFEIRPYMPYRDIPFFSREKWMCAVRCICGGAAFTGRENREYEHVCVDVWCVCVCVCVVWCVCGVCVVCGGVAFTVGANRECEHVCVVCVSECVHMCVRGVCV